MARRDLVAHEVYGVASASGLKINIPIRQKTRKVPDITFEIFEMSEPGIPSIDQLKVFLTVVEAGSFTAAARRLNRAVSAISYTIANLEQHLGVLLFDRGQTRTPKLTEAGSAVLSKAKVVAVGVDDLRASVRALLQGSKRK
jgi:hypothetical protein